VNKSILEKCQAANPAPVWEPGSGR